MRNLEAASVVAFSELADRLTKWGAPPDLVARCHQAAREESDHAALLGALAREAGAKVDPATKHPVTVDLARAALDNAIEGCVHEAWSALACAATARDAQDPRLRAVYTRLAADEAGHAQLAWDLHTWFTGRVSTNQRASIRAAQKAAIAGLPARAHTQSRHAPAALAFPDARAAAHFAAGLARAALACVVLIMVPGSDASGVSGWFWIFATLAIPACYAIEDILVAALPDADTDVLGTTTGGSWLRRRPS